MISMYSAFLSFRIFFFFWSRGYGRLDKNVGEYIASWYSYIPHSLTLSLSLWVFYPFYLSTAWLILDLNNMKWITWQTIVNVTKTIFFFSRIPPKKLFFSEKIFKFRESIFPFSCLHRCCCFGLWEREIIENVWMKEFFHKMQPKTILHNHYFFHQGIRIRLQ